MKGILFIAILTVAYFNGQAQTYNVGDSIKVSFARLKKKTIDSSRDLDLYIAIKNISRHPVRAYKTLWYDRMPSPLGNYDCQLYKKTSKGYNFVDHYSQTSGYRYFSDSLIQIYSQPAADSILHFFDIYKDTLLPGSTNMMQFNILNVNHFLKPGQYRFRIAFRLWNDFRIDPKSKELRQVEHYIYSDWNYFDLSHTLIDHLKQRWGSARGTRDE
jgi:hypothetical protein